MKSVLTGLISAALAHGWWYVWTGPDGALRRGLAILIVVIGFGCVGLAGLLGWTLFKAPLNLAIMALMGLLMVIGIGLLITASRAFREGRS